MFGLKYEGFGEKADRYWGARAIYVNGHRNGPRIDLLHDRMSSAVPGDGEDDATKAFFDWINEKALPALRKLVEKIYLDVADPKLLVLKDGEYELRATTNRSYGYLYIGATEGNDDEGRDPADAVGGALIESL